MSNSNIGANALGRMFLSAAITVLTGASAIAADTAAPAPALEQIVVTGSRIIGLTNATSASPISVISAEEIKMTSAANVEDALLRLTGVDSGFGGTTNSNNNGGTGLSVQDLRGLGPARTLILVDGVRLISTYSGTTEVTDISSIPLAMVERIEVLRDGASSIYGADAIGGVINVITKKHSEGATFDASFGDSQHGDGQTKDLAGTIGFNTEKGNVLVGVSWDHVNPIEQANRRWAVDPHLGENPGEGGSTYRSQLDVLQAASGSTIWVNGVQTNYHNQAIASQLPNDQFLTLQNRYKLNSGAPTWNYLNQGLDRKNIALTTHYDLSDNVTFVADGYFTDRTAFGSLRPEPYLNTQIAAGSFPGFIVPAWELSGNPNDAGGNLVANLTPPQVGARRYEDDSKTSRIRAGFEGKFFSEYHWEVGFVDQHNSTLNLVHNETNFQNLMQVLGLTNCTNVPGGCVAATAAQSAASAAATALAPSNNGLGLAVSSVPKVVPNWKNGPYGIFTPAQVAYLSFDNPDQRTSTQRVAYADISGPLFSLPAGPLKGAVGVEHRNESLSDNPNAVIQDVGPNRSNPTSGGYSVKSAYIELNAPILKDMPFAKTLNADLSARYDDYNTFGSTTTYKFGVDFAPIEDIRFRATLSTGFRAPNVAELFGGTALTDLPANGDPCDTRASGLNGNTNVGAGVLSAGSTCSKAIANGAAVTNFTPSTDDAGPTQQQVQVGGNPHLSPEKSNQYGFGGVITPRYTPGLSLAIDYYNIKIRNTVLTGGIVGATNVDTVLLGCYGPAQNAAYCSFIHRNPQGVIFQIDSLADSFGVARVTGIDYELVYDTDRAHLNLPIPGSLRFDLQVSEAYKNTQTNADGTTSSYVGQFQQQSAETIAPKWKGLAGLDYHLGPWAVHWDTRFIEHMTSYDSPGDRSNGDILPNIWYHAISGSYTLSDSPWYKGASIVVGINNLMNKDPPFLNQDTTCKCNSLAGPYDFIGRYFYGRVSMKF